MVKTRVHELAAEFGVTSEQLIQSLKEMNIFVRSHLSALEAGQVSALRVRWEREKRKSAEEPKPKRGGRRKAAEPVEPVAPAAPVRRRRTAAEVAKVEAEAAAEAEAQASALAALEAERELTRGEAAAAARSLEDRARELFKDLPPLEAEAAVEPAAPPVRRKVEDLFPSAPPAGAPSAPASAESAAQTPVAPRKPFIPPRIQRPAPGSPPPASSGAPAGRRGPPSRGPRPVFSSATGPSEVARPREFGPDAKKGDFKKGKKKRGKNQVDQEAVSKNILKTMKGMKGSRKSRGRSDEPSYRDVMAGRAAEEREKEKTRIRVNEFISVSELADLMKVPSSQIVQFAFKELGLMVTVNQRLDFDQIELIASQFGFEALREDEYAADLSQDDEQDPAETLKPRAPVVTIMGHVDHGKTSLLDYIRHANIVAGEAGGITQHIGAYHVELPSGRRITFLDTPGHEAFTAMRARGAQVTDIVVLVVAADDQVMPQTVEAISHAKNAGVPLIVAINKVDLPSANVQKTMQDLLQHQVVLEEFGGDVLSAAVSAKKGTGVDLLLEKILLQADVLDLKANPDHRAQGTVVESTLDPGKGPLATLLVQRGTLKVGENFICGKFSGRVRALFDERGNTMTSAGPSMPVQILGFDGVPSAGDSFLVVADAAEARDIAQKRQRLEREAQNRRGQRGGTLEDFSRALKEGQVTTLPIIIKADQGGPAEALADALAQLSTPEVRVEVVHRGVGAISDSDVLLAKASGAIILGFHVRPDSNARASAEREQVDIRTYRVIYEAVDDIRNALEGLLKPEERETVLGEAEVLQVFKVSKVGTIAGSIVRSGMIQRGTKARVVRDGVTVYAGSFSSLKRFKDDVKEVREGLECGIGIENFNDVKVGDRIESFRLEEIKRTLEPTASAGAA
ncbi:MAG TPA: translation initiation factor IF-2 [Gemmatimonadales bacterium]|nr:translation initiation factor IF-2 [Gemmatimonadales bacterium]